MAAPKSQSSEGLHKRYLETRGDVEYNVFKRAGDKTSLAYVENSGICETTPGVTTYSGYLDADLNSLSTMHMWYWFFEARANPTTAPLVLWLNGGPGCSSMIGLFQEHGPCHFVNGSTEPSLNEYSWNNVANMLYVDEPIGVGFSYGTDSATSTVTAAEYVWQFLQNFYAAFPTYESRDFALFTESYGGHYGPEFSSYFQSQNAQIEAGTIDGEVINLIALGINNGWIDPELQYQAYPIFAYNNTYNQLITLKQLTNFVLVDTEDCVPAYASCTGLTGNNAACLSAGSTCSSATETPIEEANNFNVYDVLEPRSDESTDPPETYADYLAESSVMTAIGAQTDYQECPTGPYAKIVATGDEARSFLEPLAEVVQSGVNVLIWAGDLDWICNWYGSQLVVNNLNYTDAAEFQATELSEYTVDGVSGGQFKSVGNLNFLRVYEAGHEVPYYQPVVALQAFTQMLQDGVISST
ncbi:putative carboxypeptidase S1 [Cryphonectria parasitica EP155]|uniref:Carboxypeptidase n=1 Tax=Cryphonectria parasitica (strain ATCC 38755 / EP155) TaxID=660469 RepID=A0A9P4XW78_CRYP1|nr:putative carboxypeptidase S1 [Cryphonectria parasitica EP155]KAF3761952.1 putative carboxypeptidase S1 [Cryphonectria parasitica EP155]